MPVIVHSLSRRMLLALAAAALSLPMSLAGAAAAERHLLYVAEPGIRSDVEWG